jgi:UDP-N-acetylmuramoyl-L-alanyl-D-glutamate--2,6-diaminopimelate ligase
MPLTPRRVALAPLAAAAGGELRGDAADTTTVTDVVLDTAATGPGALFCCIPGTRADGHDFAAKAVELGAVALVVERPLDAGVPQILVPAVRPVLPALAAAFFDRPSARLDLVGVTGTNGKTTTTYMLEAIARADRRLPGVIGTVEVRIGDRRLPQARTTPESPDLQRLLAEMADEGVGLAAMEVSSHGLALGRVDLTSFKVAIFTNLTQDHLDFHPDMEDYFRAKAKLFTPAFSAAGVVNVDDSYGRRLAAEAPIPVVTTGTGPDADWRATDVEASLGGTAFTVTGPAGTARVELALAGAFNVANALGALAAADRLGIALDTAARGLAALPGVPGRFERVDAGQPFTVLVDYSHTPDSLSNALVAARKVAEGRVLVVFGCGGDRDRAKRPIMGRIAGELADVAIVTSDNPRSEEPSAIVDEVAAGTKETAKPGAWRAEVDRRAAIHDGLASARPGDVVLIAGKGHEQGQEFAGGHKIPFDDRVVAAGELAALGFRGVPA